MEDMAMRSTIDYGIDLGTTNSAICVLKGTETEIIKNNEDIDITPSAVWLDQRARLRIGRTAKERVVDDPENAYAEFKLQMGTEDEKVFGRDGRRMRPEALSAEVLKSLRDNVAQRYGEDISAAVITVPAMFELPQCDATRRAAEMAGLTTSPLLLEPVAAALAYGFQSRSDRVFWLVYDFGGGTFDAAVVQVRDGVIEVVNHGGDNQLGGKLIDWEIVDQLLVPEVVRKSRLPDFNRGNPRWRSAIALLKYQAELAKIRLSREDPVDIDIPRLCESDGGTTISFEYELRRADVERLARPYILRSINIAKQVLTERRLSPANIEKMILVGGPTLAPYFRQFVADPTEGLGIPLEFGVDPLTVVARGAAVFAGTQRINTVASAPTVRGQYTVRLEYQPVGPDTEPPVAGRVLGQEGEDLSRFTIEFVNAQAQPPWRSGRVGLAPNGAFLTTLWAEKGRQNVFQIELFDPTGSRCRLAPDTLTYTVGVVAGDLPLTQTVGVAMANNEMDPILKKGTALTARSRSLHRTAFDVRRGQFDQAIRIPIVEGENIRRADRNKRIGELVISGSEVMRDVPAGSEIEIVIEIDPSRIVRTKAYIPILDEEFESVHKLKKEAPDPHDLRQAFEREQNRLAEARRKAEATSDAKAQQALQRIDAERMVHDIESALAAAPHDCDAADKCEYRLLDLMTAIDEVEDALEWPALVAKTENQLKDTREAVQKWGNSTHQQTLTVLERELQQIIGAREHDPDALGRKHDDLLRLELTLLREQPGWWVGLFEYLNGMKASMRDQAQADSLFARGRRNIQDDDLPGLKATIHQLQALLPQDLQQPPSGEYGGTTIR
jgi:molecular chaperone DnaK